MKITGFDHFQITMPQAEKATARQFYSGILGLTEIPKPPNLATRGGIWFSVGPQQLHVSIEADFRPARKGHPAFQVTGLEQLRRHLLKKAMRDS